MLKKKASENFPFRVLALLLYDTSPCIIRQSTCTTIRNRPFSALARSTTTRIRRALNYLEKEGYIGKLSPNYAYTTFVLYSPIDGKDE